VKDNSIAKTGFVISVPASNQVIVDIDSSFYDTFVPKYFVRNDQPQILAVGDGIVAKSIQEEQAI